MATHWFLNTIVGLVWMPLIKHVGAGPMFGVFGIVSAIGVLFSRAFVIETSSKSFQQVELEYAAASEKYYGGRRFVSAAEEEL